MNLIETLNWRYATKRMTEKKVSEQNLNTILEAIRLAPSAYGLQPYNIIVTDNKEKLDAIYEKACPQLVLKQCSHLIIFKAKKKLTPEFIECYLSELKLVRNVTDEYIDIYRGKIQRVIDNPDINKFSWTTQQAYIALGFACVVAAELGIDSTPIEGFNPQALNQFLGLDTNLEETVVLLTLGYRDEKEDHLANQPKIRKSIDELVERI